MAETMNAPTRATLERWRARMHDELHKSVIPFWMRHSLDREFGGYFNCLDRDGRRFDTKKHVWLQGRQVWMLSKLFNADRSSADLLEAATLGAKFLREHARRPDDQVYFCLARDGKPLTLQRKMYAACFYVMAFAEYARATGDASYRALALSQFDAILRWVDDPTPLGKPKLAGNVATSELAVPMILLNLVAELRGAPGSPTFHDRSDYDAIEQRCVAAIRRHHRPERGLVFETISADGKLLDSPEGRLINPGHVIECGWFLLDYARRTNDSKLRDEALAMIRGALDFGWDREFGGILYFLDSEGFSPQQLEWPMKLWWPHCEAIVALLMAWRDTSDASWFARFEQVADWTFAHFPDAEHGEWYGYLDRRGAVSQRFKGGPYKGCFHVPRALWLCERELAAALAAH